MAVDSMSADLGTPARLNLRTEALDLKRQDTLQQRIVTIGKQLSSRLYLSNQQGLESAGSVVQVRDALSLKLSLEAEAGSRSAISLFYNIAFD